MKLMDVLCILIILLSLNAVFINCETKCRSLKGLVICSSMDFSSNDLLVPKQINMLQLILLNLKNEVDLTIPLDLRKNLNGYGKYEKIIIKQVCLRSIEDNFFEAISDSKLKYLEIENVTCLNKLQTSSFFSSENFLESLTLKDMPDLKEIPNNFFNNLKNLKELKIMKTKLTKLPDNIFRILPNLQIFQANDNMLISAPQLMDIQRYDIFNMAKNPFHCNCELMPFVKLIKEKSFYSCASPEKYKGKHFSELNDICNEYTKTPSNIKKIDDISVSEAGIRLEIIIPAILVVVAILVVLIFLVVYKRRNDLQNKKQDHQINSPSKPDFDSQKPLVQNNYA